jgi:acyl-ACP thioesterase
VRLGDASAGGRLRLDAMARHLQDIANDDARDADIGGDVNAWVVRRTVIEVTTFPVYGEELTLATWCSGTGSRWAERRTSIVGDAGGVVQAASLWVHVDLASGRPIVVPERFLAAYGASSGGRIVRARLVHQGPGADASVMAWTLRFADFDVLGHVNNAAYWAVVEEQLSQRRALRAPLRAEVEYRSPVEAGDALVVLVAEQDDGFAMWWTVDGDVRTTVVVRSCDHV